MTVNNFSLQNEIHGSILLPDEEEILVREELRRLASTPDSDYSDILGRDHPDLDGRPDSQVMLDDDEDRIPEEQLLKYTKPGEVTNQLWVGHAFTTFHIPSLCNLFERQKAFALTRPAQSQIRNYVLS